MTTTKAGRYNEILESPTGATQPLTAVTVRLPGTTTPAVLYADENKSATVANPTTSDAFGNLAFWADFDTTYDLLVNGATIEDVAVTPTLGGLTGTLERVIPAAEKVVYVSPLGLDANDGLTKATAKLTFAAALAAIGVGNVGHINMGRGVITVGAGASLSGHKVTFSGKGDATILRATAQTGPVLDFTGYVYPDSAQTRREIGDFAVEGDNTAGTAKKGVAFSNTSGMTFHDISTKNTGGAGLDYGASQLNTFINLVANTPVSAKANNVPYMRAVGACNGNRFIGCGLRSVSASDDVGVGGALRFEDDGVAYAPALNQFLACWVEFLHVPTNGTLFHIEGHGNVFADTQWFDCSKEAAATGTSYMRLENAAFENSGANIVRGYVPGTQGGVTIDVGVDISQSGNHIEGVKGFNGSNVKLNAGVERTYALLGGRDGSASNAAFIDNSGTTTNVLIDAGGGAFTVVKGATVLPDLYIGSTAGPRFFPVGNALFARSDTYTFQAADGTQLAQLDKFGGYTVKGPLDHDGNQVGFYGTAPVNKQTGVAVTAAGVHAALVALGLISA